MNSGEMVDKRALSSFADPTLSQMTQSELQDVIQEIDKLSVKESKNLSEEHASKKVSKTLSTVSVHDVAPASDDNQAKSLSKNRSETIADVSVEQKKSIDDLNAKIHSIILLVLLGDDKSTLPKIEILDEAQNNQVSGEPEQVFEKESSSTPDAEVKDAEKVNAQTDLGQDDQAAPGPDQ